MRETGVYFGRLIRSLDA